MSLSDPWEVQWPPSDKEQDVPLDFEAEMSTESWLGKGHPWYFFLWVQKQRTVHSTTSGEQGTRRCLTTQATPIGMDSPPCEPPPSGLQLGTFSLCSPVGHC